MEQQISFLNDRGENLAGTLHLPDGPARFGVVFGHCFTCSRHTLILRQICENLADRGFLALRFDFSGNGQSQGNFSDSTYSKQISEMSAAIEVAAGRGAGWIGLAGHSLGAAIALLTAGRSSGIKAVCTISGRLSGLDPHHFLNPAQRAELRDTGRVFFSSRGRSLELSEGFFADARQYNLPGVVAALQIPILVVHGDRDEIVPVQEAHQARALNPEGTTLAVVRDADHMFSNPEQRSETAGMIAEWFREQAAAEQ